MDITRYKTIIDDQVLISVDPIIEHFDGACYYDVITFWDEYPDMFQFIISPSLGGSDWYMTQECAAAFVEHLKQQGYHG